MSSQEPDVRRTTTTEPVAPASERGPWSRRVLPDILLVTAVVLGVVSMIGTSLRYQIFDDASFAETSRQLIAEDVIRQEVATTLVDAVFAEVDVAAAIEERLPEAQKGFSGPAAAVVQDAAPRAVDRLLQRPRLQGVFVDAASTAQRLGIRVLEDDLPVGELEGGWIVLDLRRTAEEVSRSIPLLGAVADRLPEDAARIRLVEARRLDQAQTATSAFRTAAVILPWVVLVLLALSVWLARGQRRRQLLHVAVGIIVTGVLVVVARGIAGRAVVDAVVASDTVRPAAEATWEILTRLLVDSAWTAVIVGAFLLAGVWVTGDRGLARGIRHRVAQYLERREIGYGLVVAAMLAMAWWQPTEAFGRPVSLLVLTALLAGGYEALRAQLARESAAGGLRGAAEAAS
jgi:hypothetical protein